MRLKGECQTPSVIYRGEVVNNSNDVEKVYFGLTDSTFKERYTFFYINNQKFKQSHRKSLICYTISKQFARANKRRKLNNPLREQAKTLFLHRKPERNAHFWTCQFKSVHYIL